MNCHPDRSEAKWRDLLFACSAVALYGSAPLPFVIPRGCDFFVFSHFDAPNHNAFKTHHKTVILSEAPRRSIA